MLFQIACRNILRNKRRSLIILAAIMVGLWGGLVASAVSLGFAYETIRSALETRLSHFQVHEPRFRESRNIRDTIPGGAAVLNTARRLPAVRAVTGRVVVEGMASTAETAVGVVVYGVDADTERGVTTIAGRLTEGTYALGKKDNALVIGEDLAGKLDAHLRSKIILTMQDVDGQIIGGSFRVAGIYRTDSKPFDGTTVFVARDEISALLGLGEHMHEIAAVLEELDQADSVAAEMRNLAPSLAVETWMELAPELRYINKYTELFLNIFLYVIILALLFGITNTMLMSVLERVREFGVLTAVGMRGRRIFTMIMLESLALSLAGGILGMITGGVTVEYLKRTGIDLSAFGEGLRQWGYTEITYPVLPLSMYEQVILSVALAAILGAVYPAWKAVRLDAAQAIRTY